MSTRRDIDVTVTEGEAVLQQCPCSLVTFPDASPGVLWRGKAYPLLPGNRIDIRVAPERRDAPLHAVLPGEQATWILIQGLRQALESAQRAIERAGVAVSRIGRWLGDPVGGVPFDWFIRCVGALDAGMVAEALAARTQANILPDAADRAAILEQRIAGLLGELADLKSQLNKAQTQPQMDILTEPTTSDEALKDALQKLAILQAERREVPSTQAHQSPANIRFHEELAMALRALRPDIVLVRDSLMIAVGEFQSREGFYRAIQDLPPTGSRPDGWKKIQSVDRCWERHVSTGRDNTGRAYARFNPDTRQWSLLLGWKAEQSRDLEWLRNQI